MAEGVLVVDERGRIIMINEAIEKLFSLSTEVVDKTPLSVLRLEGKSISPMVSIYLLKFNVLLRFERMRRGLPYPVVDFS